MPATSRVLEVTPMLLACLVLLLLALSAGLLPADPDESWKLPLAQKERLIEQNIVERHNILGLYPSMVEVPLDGSPVDQSTLGASNIAHSCVWTAYYLEGACYRYAVLKRDGAPAAEVEAARKRADEIFESLYRLQLVTGIRGLQARGYALGHGEAYEERENASTRNEWHQGSGEYRDLRWRGDPSHHNYSATAHAFCQYYDLAAEGRQRERCREAMDGLVSYWVDNNLNIQNYPPREDPVPILGMTDGKTLNTRVLMAIAAAAEAWHVTSKAKFKATYDRLVEQYGVRTLKQFRTEKNHDDGQHVFCHLEALWRIEQDPALRAAYRKVADGLWANHRGDAQSTFTYIYLAINPEAEGREQALQQALYSLQTWPVESTLRPQMNSLFPERKPPFPTYQASWDNEYHWKGNLLEPDGWLSRIVTQVAVPAEDPMVIYALDQNGDLYQSRDGAATPAGWRWIGAGLRSPVRAIAVGSRIRVLAAACDDGFYLTTTAGARWERLPIPEDGGKPQWVEIDPLNNNIIYAATDKAAYRSPDFGEQFLGRRWESLTADLPPADQALYRVSPGKPGRVWAVLGGIVFSRRLDQPQWQRGGTLGLPEYVQTYPWLVLDPSDPDHALAGMKVGYGPMGVRSALQETTDGGATWSNDYRSLRAKWSKQGMRGLLEALIPGEIVAPAIDPTHPRTLYTAAERGVMVSKDGGQTWAIKDRGLRLPLAKAVMRPRNADWVFAGTPGGLYLSKDGGETWQDGNLWLQFQHNTRREIGSGAYIDAYWRGRYYGFIDQATAEKAWEGK